MGWLSPTLYALGWLSGTFLLARIPRIGPGADGRTRAVVVPARNEERRLGPLLATVPSQRRPGDEVVVVDDGSTDRTTALAAAAGCRVVAAGDPPPGWTGKTRACWAGAQATTAEVLVFLDADVELAPGALDRLAAEQARGGGLVSVQPWHDVRRPYERLSLFPNLVALMGSGACTALGRRLTPAAVFGPVLVVDRPTYLAVGGHRAVRGEVAEDIALGRRITPRRVFGGRGVARFRMYPEGPGSLVEGWTKNLAAGAGATPWWAVALVTAWIWSLAGGWAVHPGCYLVSAAQVWWMGRRVGRYGPLTALGYAVPLAVFVWLVGRSWWRRARRRPVTWRGRRLSA